ncbi:molybdenum cofactor guanylyltransferase MobA [Paucibacter sp. APW11]|uniref:Molybdenum cofactor guanylyltransferase n=1 Tax=Roseateles aquae TaxID=3077235 RepID=A0ABU3PGT1_9BURK|nr:molybdenum cofactor guanylyltransferase MobA [Paucibacter sp. APW11]MDT9001804.1 molybdenum cofactor guanylyltransferase MobA [Paucibacter sp. APW11]
MTTARCAADITGLILAGGRGRRMGGADKGLLLLDGRPLAAHVLARLAPQVAALMINANRHAEAYQVLGAASASGSEIPVIADPLPGEFAGPLAGMLAGLCACGSEWLLAVPCDSPRLPLDLGQRLLAAAQAADADLAVPLACSEAGNDAGREPQIQPVFCLLRRSLIASLARYLDGGERQLQRWQRQQRHVLVRFDRPEDALAFGNTNTPEDLAALAAPAPAR